MHFPKWNKELFFKYINNMNIHATVTNILGAFNAIFLKHYMNFTLSWKKSDFCV